MSTDKVPSPPLVFTKPLVVRLESLGIEAEVLAVRVFKLPVVPKRLVAKRLVVVA